MARRIRPGTVVTQSGAIDLGDAAGDVNTEMLCPNDGAKVINVQFTMHTAGTGSAANHDLILEHGAGAAGVALTTTVALDADGAAGLIVEGVGLSPESQPDTVKGTTIQILNAESAAISDGAIINVSILWQL